VIDRGSADDEVQQAEVTILDVVDGDVGLDVWKEDAAGAMVRWSVLLRSVPSQSKAITISFTV
jgi:hypothetical protein